MTKSKKPPKIGKHYRAIVEKGCLTDAKFGCLRGYTWKCDDCPCVMEEIKKSEARLKSLGNYEKQCKKCKEVFFAKGNFYTREIDRYGFPQPDSICKQCADKQNFLYKQQSVKKVREVKDWGVFKRSTREGFKFYMQQNPDYFTGIFHKECTDANIEYEFNLLDILDSKTKKRG